MADDTPKRRTAKIPEGVSPEVRALLEADPTAVYDPVDDYPERPLAAALSPDERKRLAEAEKVTN
jgi:tRNA nucleotidyltransferase (CCA-adding enzyme)